MPIYERRITKQQFMHAFGFVAKPVALRDIFQDLTHDESAPTNLNVKAIDDRFKYAMECEDAKILVTSETNHLRIKVTTSKSFWLKLLRSTWPKTSVLPVMKDAKGSSCTSPKQLASKIYTNGVKKEYLLGPTCHQ